MNCENKEDDEKNLNKFAKFIFGGVVIAWIVSWILMDLFISSTDRGVFGDKFGSINSLFSGLAFAGLIYAILLQRIELKLQRRELELTRDELSGQRKEFEEQNKTLKRQRFENTFFQMLSMHNEIVNSMGDGSDSDAKIGRHLLEDISSYCKRRMSYDQFDPKIMAYDFDRVVSTYLKIYDEYQSSLGHYFRFLYRFIKFIDESEIENKRFYTNIIRAQLSNQETIILFYNCLCGHGKKFKKYVEEYALLDNVHVAGLVYPEHLILCYDPKAYGGEYPRGSV